jgi:hypothetical protein
MVGKIVGGHTKQREKPPCKKLRRMMFTIFTLQTYLILMSVIMGKLGTMPLTGLKKTLGTNASYRSLHLYLYNQ